MRKLILLSLLLCGLLPAASTHYLVGPIELTGPTQTLKANEVDLFKGPGGQFPDLSFYNSGGSDRADILYSEGAPASLNIGTSDLLYFDGAGITMETGGNGNVLVNTGTNGDGPSPLAGASFEVLDDLKNSSLYVVGFTNAAPSTGPLLSFRQADGDHTTPTATQSTDTLGLLNFLGYGTTAYVGGTAAKAVATQNFTDSHAGSKLQFYTTPNNSTTGTLALTLDQDQSATFANTVNATTFVGAFSGTVTNADHVLTTAVSSNASYFPLFAASSSNGYQSADLGTGLSFNPSTNTLTTTTFSGNATTATTATNATNVATTATNSTNAAFYPTFVASSSSGNQGLGTATGLAFNPSTNTLSSTSSLTVATPTLSGTVHLTGGLTTNGQVAVISGGGDLGSIPYTSANTNSAMVQRDGSGNFSAGTITAALTGTASGNTTYSANNHGVVLSSATNSMTVIAPDASTSKVLVSGGSSADPAWGTVAAGAMPALTGDVTSSAGSTATTVAKIQTVTVSGVTGTTNVVMSASPTLSGTVTLPSGSVTSSAWSAGSSTFATSGVATLSGTTDASSSTTGNLINSGGEGIAKKLFVGTGLAVGGGLAVSGDSGLYASVIGTATTGNVEIGRDTTTTATGSVGAVKFMNGANKIAMILAENETGSASNTGTLYLKTMNAGTLTDAVVIDSTQNVKVPVLTASQAVFTDSNKKLVSNAISGSGNVMMSASPTTTGTLTAAAITASGVVQINTPLSNGFGHLRLTDNLTDANTKQAILSANPYTNANKDLMVFYSSQGSSASDIYFGGGASTEYTATGLHFYTAANNTTTTGTERLSINSSGVVNISNLTASQAVFTDSSKNLVSNAITGSGNVMMSASPTTTGTLTAAAITASGTVKTSGGCVMSPVVTAIGNTGSAQSIDLSTGNVWTGTLNVSSTFTFSNAVSGCPYVFILTQGSGGQTLTTAGITTIWGNTGAKTLSTGSGNVDKITCIYNGGITSLMCDLGTKYQ